MPFIDVIDSYANGTIGTLTTSNGGSVGYSITSNVITLSRPGIDRGARVTADGIQRVEVAFDETVHGVTVAMGASNAPEVYFFVIDGIQIDLNAAIADGTVEFTQAGAATHIITASGGLTSTGGPGNGSVAFIHFQSPVNSIEIFGTGGGNGNFDVFDIGIDSEDFRVVCFAGETDIAVPNGTKRASEICAGDIVVTADGAQVQVIAVSMRRIKPIELARELRLSPVLIKAGALGQGLPTRDLRVSRQHRILIASRIAARLCSQTEILVPAHKLVGLPGIELDRSLETVDFYHILLDRHDVLLANGAPAESLFLGFEAGFALKDQQSEIPRDWLGRQPMQQMTPARPLIGGKNARKVVEAHLKQGRPILEEWKTDQPQKVLNQG